MKTFASPIRRAPARRATSPSPQSLAETAAVRRILHSARPQAKLTVGAPDDAFEKEADQVADRVMRMPEPGVQRMCAECEEQLQAEEEPGHTPSIPEGFDSRFAALQGGGRQLLAHELTHTIQQGAVGELRFKRRRPEDDPIHQPILEQYRREEGLPESGIDPQTGLPVGPSPGAIKYGPWPGDVATPAAKPSLTAVPEVLPLASCGKVTPGMDPAKAEAISDCIYHTRFVNFMNQSIANMAQVASPYAPGIAAAYQAALAEVVKAGQTSPPTAAAPKTFTVKNLTVTVSPGITLPIASFELKLFRKLNGANGKASGTGVELNEESGAALLLNQADIERTMYHEGFHWLSGEVSSHNRQVRQGYTKGTIVRPELDSTFTDAFETEFRTAAEPIWKDALATVPLQSSAPSTLTPKGLSGIHWLKIGNEVLSRVEEAVYLNLRQGKGFSRRFDLPDLAQGWLATADYWDSGVLLVQFHFQKFLTANKDRINRELLPVVQKIQREYLRRRAKP
jgi:hypothetical protein